jgi:hypothetical protein
MYSYISTDWRWREVSLGSEPIKGSHIVWNMAIVVKKVLLRHHLMKKLFAETADNASNNSTLQCSLEAALAILNFTRNAKAMTFNCLAHMLYLSAKVLLDCLCIKYSILDSNNSKYSLTTCGETITRTGNTSTIEDGTAMAGTVGKV